MKTIFEHAVRIGRTDKNRIEKALMIWTNQERCLQFLEILQAPYFHSQEHSSCKVHGPQQQVSDKNGHRPLLQQLFDFRDVSRIASEYLRPISFVSIPC